MEWYIFGPEKGDLKYLWKSKRREDLIKKKLPFQIVTSLASYDKAKMKWESKYKKTKEV